MTRYSIELAWDKVDKARERDELKAVDLRLEAWGIWARSSGVSTATARAIIITEPDPDDKDLFKRQAKVVIIDEECEQIDKVLAAMAIRPGEHRYWKLANIEYRTYGVIETKARRAHLSTIDYRTRLKHLQLLVKRDLDSLHKKM